MFLLFLSVMLDSYMFVFLFAKDRLLSNINFEKWVDYNINRKTDIK